MVDEHTLGEGAFVMMNLANCSICGRLYNRTPREMCPNCMREEEETFERVRQYIKTNGQATMKEICEALEISEDRLIRFLKDGRLMSSSTLNFPCEGCGKPIQTGRYCDGCRRNLKSSMSKAITSLGNDRKEGRGAYYTQKRDR